jgi:hypothetical protein
MNLAFATVAALALHLLIFLPDAGRPWIAENLKNALIINVLLAIFNRCLCHRSMVDASRSACSRMFWRARWPGWNPTA